jgi:hypothetical protein
MSRALGRTTFAIALAAAGVSAEAQNPFDGLWVDDLKTQMGQAGFDKYLVANGNYRCDSCTPVRSYPADGKLRPVAGASSPVSESVRIAGPRTIVTRIVDKEMTRVTTMTVAPDGKSATYVSLDQWPGRAGRLRTEYIAKRMAPAPAGAHSVSGSWRGLRYIEVPVQYRSVQLREQSGKFSRSDYRYGRYTAPIGGPPVRITGDGRNIFEATVRAPDARTRVETVLLKGKPVEVTTYRLSADGKSLVTAVGTPKSDSPFTATAHRAR